MTRLTGLRIFIFQLEGVRQLSQLATINPWQQLGPFSLEENEVLRP